MKDFLHHLFLPKESNNHRAKLLHHQSILFIIVFFLLAQFAMWGVKANYRTVLGVSTDISSQTLLLLTNVERQQKDLPQLVLNDKLSNAASLKAQYMFANNYWAHNAPDGTTPWVFIKQSGYDYVYAGENLARGFTTSSDVIRAWMASPTHRDNMLSNNYRDIGFAILEGKLLGEDTTLVVEMFGNTKLAVLPKQTESVTNQTPQVRQNVAYQGFPQSLAASVKNSPLIDSFSLSWYVSIGTLFFFISILILDMIIIERRKIIRVVGHNLDHIIFLGLILLLATMIGTGVIL